jgi:Tfp pilus assembly protein PilF
LIESNPGDAFLHHALALEYIKKGEDTKARELFESILSRDPGYVGSYYHLAKLYERTGETELAVKTYERGIEEARRAGDDLSLREMRSALEELIF